MPRQININGLRALIKHNVIKSLAKEKLTKKQYIATLKKIEIFIDSASIVDLKQKGIVKNIINIALGSKTNNIIKGEGKRKRDQEEEEARRKLFENVNPEKIQQLTLPEASSTAPDALTEPDRTQPHPKERSWISKLIWKDLPHKESKENPKLTPYKSWIDTPYVGSELPSSTDRPRTQHYSRSVPEQDTQRHKMLAHRNTLSEVEKDVGRRRNRQEQEFMKEDEQIRRNAIENEGDILFKGNTRLLGYPTHAQNSASSSSSSSSSSANETAMSSIARRRQALLNKNRNK